MIEVHKDDRITCGNGHYMGTRDDAATTCTFDGRLMLSMTSKPLAELALDRAFSSSVMVVPSRRMEP